MEIASWFFSAYNGIASEIRSRGRIRMLRFSHVHRMGVALVTSKKEIDDPTKLDFVREIEMWCSVCAVFRTVNTIDLTIDFAKTKSVR
jgi:hypothetical protein